MFTIYSADVTGNPGNCSYPHKHVILDEASLKSAISHDYVCAEYRNSYRNGENFIGSDCLPVDCDNDHSENPADWMTPEDVMQAFPGVTFAIHFSRFHNREKNGKAARPKFHVLFPIEHCTDAALYSDMKKLVNSIFPYFDTQALDAARFFFGTATAEVALYPGRMNLTEFLNEDLFDEYLPQGDFDHSVIPEGSRNATMSRFAGHIHQLFGLGLGGAIKDGLSASVLHFGERFHKVVSGFLQLATGQFMGNGLRSRLGFLPVVVRVADKVCGGRIAQFAGEVFSQHLGLSHIGVILWLITGRVVICFQCHISILLGELGVKTLGRMPDSGQLCIIQRRHTFCSFLQEGLVGLFGIAIFLDDTASPPSGMRSLVCWAFTAATSPQTR